MAKYIHVTSVSKTPENRGSSGSPFEEWASDPNDGTTFGPGERTMFLLVEEPGPPAHNQVTEKLTLTYTPDVDGKDVRGVYVPGDEVWRFTFTVEANTLEDAREAKKDLLSADQDAAFDLGYSVGQFVFPFNETFFRQLADRHYWMDIAINDGEIPAGASITFADRHGKEVSASLSQLRTHFRQYGSEYLRIFEKEVDARDAIEAANTVAQVDAVAWDFSAP